ncbi:type I phosphomannose isomerase catalytic subunit [Halanaerobium hydrogeniformans]|uniref:Phosphohexomutase n=1 Tax=Halanaerobium hydrogeniformans TaxID=656519 RepID=E4RMX7_HALHG|nr:type I phosphomannose isomerase catalytic subunit [Halanaerobium hydrogeniformans]ADQ14194.1 mannose-6-phosphate isomerase, class I [Halanaerobium hydrogeniformans]
MFYPLKFDHKYIEKVWGGKKLSKYRDDMPEKQIGESWDVSAQKKAVSVVKNGKLAGKSLSELAEMYPVQIMGEEFEDKTFPLLLKIIDTQEQLSIQVHPDKRYAAKFEGEASKNEGWYIIDAAEDAYLIIGTKDCTESEFKKAVQNKEINKYVNKVKVEKGDVFFIKAGLLHAIGPGILMAEIQETSDTTYRIFDYDRGRELHLAKAMDVINFKLQTKKRKGLKVCAKDYDYTYYCLTEELALDIIDLKDILHAEGDRKRFYILTAVKGEGFISWEGGELEITESESVLIPAYAQEYKIEGDLKLMRSYVPDFEKQKEEIIDIIT